MSDANGKTHCENFEAIIHTKTDDNIRLIARTRCKQWTCEYCAERNRKQWQARILEHINQNKELDWSWFTLTAHAKKRGATASLRNLRNAWQALIKRVKRRYKDVGKIHYCRVYERHKDGSYHLHCIISIKWREIKVRRQKDGKKVSYDRWLAKTAKSMNLGYYTHAENFDGKHAGYIAGYVTKYMTKLTFEGKKELGRIRHIQTSQGWTKKEMELKYEWSMKSGYYIHDFTEDMKDEVRVLDLQTGEFLSSDNFLETYVYPVEFDHK